jgi:putative ABC transport system permease protein
MTRTFRIVAGSIGTLRRHRLRTFFMMLGTFVGVTALTVTLAIGRDTQNDVMSRLDRMLGGSTILLRAGGNRMIGGAHSAGPTTTLTLADLQAIRVAVPGIEIADPMVMAPAQDVIHEGSSSRIPVTGYSEASEIVWNRSVTRGNYFTADDVTRSARVALIGEVAAKNLFGRDDPVGAQIRIGTVPFQVIGVLEHVGLDPHGIDKDNEIIIPVSTMMRRLLNVDFIGGAKFAVAAGTDLDNTVLEIGDVLRRRHGLNPDENDDFAMFTPVQVQQMVKGTNRVFTVVLPLLAALSIVVGSLVVAVLMLMTVNERRWEIGLRKAIGARARDIRLQFLIESAATTTLGGLFGLATAFAIMQALDASGSAPGAMPWQVALLGLATAVLAGTLSGIVPARRAAALDPVQTLR